MTRPPSDKPRKSTARPPAKPPRPAAKPAPAASEKPAGSAERIAKVLARSGIASRRDAERIIAEGRVTVNGKVIESPALDVTPKDRITVDGKPLAAPEPPRLWLYHKPAGLVTTARDELGRPTVFEHLPEDLPRVMTIGRLDLTSEGLLLLTNDGDLKRRLELPSTGWLRRYRVRVNGRPEDSEFEPLRQGIVIEGERFQPMVVTLDRQQGANAWLTVGIREGRNREVRRAMESVGYAVNRLIRISYGPFQLGDLAQGDVEEVRPRLLRDQLGLAETPLADPTPDRGGKPGPGPRPRVTTRSTGRPDRAADRMGEDETAARPAKSRRTAAPSGARGLAASAERWAADHSRGERPAKPATTRGGARDADAAPRGRKPAAEQTRADKPAASRNAAPAPGGSRPAGKPAGERSSAPRTTSGKPGGTKPGGGLGRGGARQDGPPRNGGPAGPRKPGGGGRKP